MTKISMITEHNSEKKDGSTIRPKWQIKALIENGYKDIELIDNFKMNKMKKVQDKIFHAHQLSGRFLDGVKYISDIHGLEFIHSSYLKNGYPFYSWRKWSFFYKTKYYKKLEEKIFRNSIHLICAGESIFERVSKIQNSTLVRNAVFIKDFEPVNNDELKIALVGPFLPGKINYMGVKIIRDVIRNLPKINFVLIGKTDQTFRNELNFKNAQFLGEVNNYLQELQKCSVLLSPYPDYAHYLGSKNKFLEAAASQMPIITTPSGATDFNNELLLIGKNSEEIIEKIEYLKSDNIRKEIGKELLKEIKNNHNAIIESKKIIKIYNEFN